MNENEFDLTGMTFVAVESSVESGCDGCDLWGKSTGCASNLFAPGRVPGCTSEKRTDGMEVIFKEKQ